MCGSPAFTAHNGVDDCAEAEDSGTNEESRRPRLSVLGDAMRNARQKRIEKRETQEEMRVKFSFCDEESITLKRIHAGR